MGRDIRYAFRALRRQPAFALITVLTLALGIGANTAVFSVVNGVLLRPLGYPQPERLEFITSQFPTLGFDQFWVSLPEFVEFRQHNQTFSNVGAYNIAASNLGTTTPSRPVTALVTPELMPTLGVPALRGRVFTAEDSAPNAPPVAILSHELWQRSFGGDPQILGQRVRVNDQQTEVVGVMPAGFDVHDQKVELWLPLTIDPATFPNRRGGHFLYLVGRLKDAISREQALADVERMLGTWRSIAPQGHVPSIPNHKLRMDPLREDVVGGIRRALVILQVAVGFVLLIACANLANLLIARADARRREYAVRSALGASRGRLFAQLLTEGLMLAVSAAVIGVGLAYVGLRTLVSVNPDAIPRTSEIRLDLPVLAFTLGVATVTGLVFALVPLFHIRGDRVGEAVKDAGARTTSGARVWVRSGLVVVEVALAVTLVVGAGLLIRSFMNLMRVDLGFDRAELSTFGVVLPGLTYNAARRITFYGDLALRLRAIPGVRGVAAASGLPPLRNVNANDTDFVHIPNNRPPGTQPMENVDYWQFVSVGYVETMGIPVVSGRPFEPADTGGAPVVLVNEALVTRFFTDRDPIGQRIKPFGFGDDATAFTVVGVLRDVKQRGVGEAAGTELYMLADQMPKYGNFAPGNMNYVVRAGVPLETIAPQLRQAVQSLDPGLPVIRMRSMEEVVETAVARPRFMTVLLGVFAGLALLLAAVGTYGVLSYLVTERRQEIGIRMALGADRARILRLVLVRGLVLSAIGLAVGLGAALGVSRVLSALLYNVAPTDPRTLAAVSVVIAAVACVACVIPAWRATRVDPLVVLRDN